MTDTIILSNHHRRSRFFEETMKQLWDAGYKEIWIQDTGNERLGKYQGPCSQYRNLSERAYDHGMVAFKEWIPAKRLEKYRNIMLIDNDCFATVKAVDRFIKGFEKGEYGWSSHCTSKGDYHKDWVFEDDIAHVFDQEIKPSKSIPGFVPSPHYENCFTLMSTHVWSRMHPRSFTHGRLMIKNIYDLDVKMGAHKAVYKGGWSHMGDGWFHVGNLFRYYHYIESNDYSIFKPDREAVMARLGYFYHHGQFLQPRLKDLHLKEIAVNSWNNLTKGTVMENWK